VKRSVAVAVYGDVSSPDPPILAVRRPLDDDALPDIWGLPAATLREGESSEAAVRRIGGQKLGVVLEPVADLSEGTQERQAYLLQLRLYEARILSGEPEVPQNDATVTQYVEWKWVSPRGLEDGARRGSLCCRLCLQQLGLLD
jgi:8-oxo-dGTP diphosphatase